MVETPTEGEFVTGGEVVIRDDFLAEIYGLFEKGKQAAGADGYAAARIITPVEYTDEAGIGIILDKDITDRLVGAENKISELDGRISALERT